MKHKFLVFIILVIVACVVAWYLNRPEEFKAKNLTPAEQRQHDVAKRDFDLIAPKSVFTDSRQDKKPAAFSLPELPKIPMEQAVPVDPGLTASVIVVIGAKVETKESVESSESTDSVDS